jgi:hypothetical protein
VHIDIMSSNCLLPVTKNDATSSLALEDGSQRLKLSDLCDCSLCSLLSKNFLLLGHRGMGNNKRQISASTNMAMYGENTVDSICKVKDTLSCFSLIQAMHHHQHHHHPHHARRSNDRLESSLAVDGVELDVSLSRDGEFVLHHDLIMKQSTHRNPINSLHVDEWKLAKKKTNAVRSNNYYPGEFYPGAPCLLKDLLFNANK